MDLCEFLAEEELIEIVPKFKYNKQLNLISGDFGPFLPSVPIKIPLWLALNLHQQHKCTILLPKWVKDLIKIQEEQGASNNLLEMPSEYWREIIKLLQKQINTIPVCNDLVERREAILKSSAYALFKHAYNSTNLVINDVTLHNVTKGELYLIKSFVQKAFALLQKLRTIAFKVDQSK